MPPLKNEECMTARRSAATERAINRVIENGETIAQASTTEGVTYNTLWLALKRIKGAPPTKSATQRLIARNLELKATGQTLLSAFEVADQYARKDQEYLQNNATLAHTAKEEFRNALIDVKAKRGRPIVKVNKN